MSPNLSPAARDVLLAFADDEHMIGARHAAWIGLGPFLEEDLAFCSIAQDELGHAISLYEYLTDDVDHFALLRSPDEYRSSWLAEWPCHQWNESLVRHWLYDHAEALRWSNVEHSSVDGLGMLAARAEREESFHRDHAEMYLSRIADGDDQGRQMIEQAIAELLPVALGLWDPVAAEPDAIAEGVMAASSAELEARWSAAVTADLDRWGFAYSWPTERPAQSGRTVRSCHFPELQASLQEVIALDPTATW